MKIYFYRMIGTVKFIDNGKTLDVSRKRTSRYHCDIISWGKSSEAEIDLVNDWTLENIRMVSDGIQ